MNALDSLLAFGHEAAGLKTEHSKLRHELNGRLRGGEVSAVIWSEYHQRAIALRGDLEVLRALVGKLSPENLNAGIKARADCLADLQKYLLCICDAHLSFLKRIERGRQIGIRDPFNPIQWFHFWWNHREYVELIARMNYYGAQLTLRHGALGRGARLGEN